MGSARQRVASTGHAAGQSRSGGPRSPRSFLARRGQSAHHRGQSLTPRARARHLYRPRRSRRRALSGRAADSEQLRGRAPRAGSPVFGRAENHIERGGVGDPVEAGLVEPRGAVDLSGRASDGLQADAGARSGVLQRRLRARQPRLGLGTPACDPDVTHRAGALCAVRLAHAPGLVRAQPRTPRTTWPNRRSRSCATRSSGSVSRIASRWPPPSTCSATTMPYAVSRTGLASCCMPSFPVDAPRDALTRFVPASRRRGTTLALRIYVPAEVRGGRRARG